MLTFLFMLMIAMIAVIAQVTPNQLIEILVPVVVWVAAGFVNWLKAKLGTSGFGGTVLVTLVVPILSLAATYLASLINPNLSFWPTFFFGLLGVVINEVIKQWKQTLTKTQTKADKNLIG